MTGPRVAVEGKQARLPAGPHALRSTLPGARSIRETGVWALPTLPIPFEKSVEVTGLKWPFFHINYLRYPAGTQVKTFHLPLRPEEQEILRRGAEILAAPGKDPKPAAAGASTASAAGDLKPGDKRATDLKGPGVVDALRLKIEPASVSFRQGCVPRVFPA